MQRKPKNFGLSEKKNLTGGEKHAILSNALEHGELAEWSKAHDWKSCGR